MTDDELRELNREARQAAIQSGEMFIHELARLVEQRTIERCAEVCEKEAGAPPRWHWEDEARGRHEAARECAAAIRALKVER